MSSVSWQMGVLFSMLKTLTSSFEYLVLSVNPVAADPTEAAQGASNSVTKGDPALLIFLQDQSLRSIYLHKIETRQAQALWSLPIFSVNPISLPESRGPIEPHCLGHTNDQCHDRNSQHSPYTIHWENDLPRCTLTRWPNDLISWKHGICALPVHDKRLVIEGVQIEDCAVSQHQTDVDVNVVD